MGTRAGWERGCVCVCVQDVTSLSFSFVVTHDLKTIIFKDEIQTLLCLWRFTAALFYSVTKFLLCFFILDPNTHKVQKRVKIDTGITTNILPAHDNEGEVDIKTFSDHC